MANTTMQRTLKALRERGMECSIVEKWNSFAGIRQDAFGIGDILAYGSLKEEDFFYRGVWLVQTTTKNSRSAHRKKLFASEHLAPWIKNGGRFILITWDKVDSRWQLRWEEIKLTDLENTEVKS